MTAFGADNTNLDLIDEKKSKFVLIPLQNIMIKSLNHNMSMTSKIIRVHDHE